MKRAIPFALSAILVGGAFAPTVLGNETSTKENETNKDEGQVQEKFLKLTGTLSSLEKNENGLLHGVIEQQDNVFNIVVGQETVVVDNTGKRVELKEGMDFTAYVDGNKPMILIYPPQYSPDLVIVQTEEIGFAEVARFDENFANESLKLNISDETVIENLSGTAVEAKNIVGVNVAVFYKFTTFSIPAQTTPSKIIVLSYDEEELSEEMVQLQTIIKNIVVVNVVGC